MKLVIKYGIMISMTMGLLIAQITTPIAAPELNTIIDTMKSSNKNSVDAQKRIDALSDKSRELLNEYKYTTQETESLVTYNKHVKALIKSQDEEYLALQKQLDEIDVTGREIVPLMLRMMDSLEKFVELDIPFLKDERRKRLSDLREMMNRADVTVAEKYRRIMEAYLVELEYGRTIEAYESQIKNGEGSRSVNYLRIGRILLAYQTPDKSEMGIWNNKSRQWEPLDSSYYSSISKGLRIAKKQAAPELIRLPLPSPEHAQ